MSRCGSSEVGLLREDQRIIDFDTEVADRTLQLRMTQQELARSQIASALVDQRDLGPPQAMGAVESGIQPNQRDPIIEEAPILSGRNVVAFPT